MSQPVQRSDAFDSAAKLLVDIAGPEPVHIEMSDRGPKKYYDVHRSLNERDTRAHLLGYRTTGATLKHLDGKTRALCYDADTPDDWLHLLEGARTLMHGVPTFQPMGQARRLSSWLTRPLLN